MKWSIIVKSCSVVGLLILLLWYNFYPYFKTHPYQVTIRPPVNTFDRVKQQDIPRTNGSSSTKVTTSMKYILQWTNPHNVPFVYMGVGQKNFIETGCKYTNCFVTSDRYYLQDYTLFDVIVFNGPQVLVMQRHSLPNERSDKQKYVFASIESSDYYAVCSNRFDGYFNWTWTFRLDSESRWGYIVVRDMENKILGPNKIMHWMKLEDMDPVSEEFKHNLSSKTKAAAWFVSNCLTPRKREVYVSRLITALAKYNLTVDIYGKCGTLSCPRDDQKCDELIKTTYYFYLSFENSFSEDYVTEKLLHGLRNNAIPIVFGAANYTRFMPDGIYLNALQLDVENLAKKMNELIRDPEKYAEYFKWKNHYSYHVRNEHAETNDYCGMCALLNDDEMLKKKSVYQNFRKWWDSSSRNC